jgi:hypothetical protein
MLYVRDLITSPAPGPAPQRCRRRRQLAVVTDQIVGGHGVGEAPGLVIVVIEYPAGRAGARAPCRHDGPLDEGNQHALLAHRRQHIENQGYSVIDTVSLGAFALDLHESPGRGPFLEECNDIGQPRQQLAGKAAAETRRLVNTDRGELGHS